MGVEGVSVPYHVNQKGGMFEEGVGWEGSRTGDVKHHYIQSHMWASQLNRRLLDSAPIK